MNYLGVIGNRDYIKINGQKRPYWEFLDRQPDGWLSSLTYRRKDLPETTSLIMDCGAWSYKHHDIPPITAESALAEYILLAPPGAMLIAPDHMIIDGCDAEFRRAWNREQAIRFLEICPTDYTPMACIHGSSIEERLEHLLELRRHGYRHFAIGGVAAMAAKRKQVVALVREIRRHSHGEYLHVLGLSSPSYVREWKILGVDSCDGSSHFKQAFTGGAFFCESDGALTKHRAVRPGESCDHLPVCDCTACATLRTHGVDTRSYGSNEHNMGRAAHNQNMLMRAHQSSLRLTIGLVACCGRKLTGKHAARDLYQSTLFKKSAAWAEANCDKWLILSAKYGVLDPDTIIQGYDLSLTSSSATYRRAWGEQVSASLSRYREDDLVVLAGNRYCEWIIDDARVSRPLSGLGIGLQLQWLSSTTTSSEVSSDCHQGVLI